LRILFLISDTGGGHRAAAKAISVALSDARPSCEIATVDGLVAAASFPANKSPQIYAWGMKGWGRVLWGLFFHLLNGRVRARLYADVAFPGLSRRLATLIRDQAPDVVVSTHPLLTRVVSRALGRLERRIPFAIVVTDLVTGHATWYDDGADLVCLPTAEALERAAACGVPRERMIVAGQPLHPKAAEAVARRDAIRTKAGWTEPVVLVVGGGDGVGDIGSRVRALAAARIPARIVVICGKNEKLRGELAAGSFAVPVEVFGFVDDLPEKMAAADVLVTKGGPGSVMEGCLAGLPILVYDYLPGQEVGNVRLVERAGAGKYVPKNDDLVREARALVEDAGRRADAGGRARALAVPDSARRIAAAIIRLSEEARDPRGARPVAER
jgi:1,2-diacylglycerol 3-beta-galactosyltransferase